MLRNCFPSTIRSLRSQPLFVTTLQRCHQFRLSSTDHQQEFEELEEVAPDLENLDNRWSKLKQEDQHDIIDYLKDQQELDWRTDMNLQEKKAAYYLAYGNWGPRDGSLLNIPEFVFRLMSSSLLFMVLGFSLVNHFNDKEKLDQLEE